MEQTLEQKILDIVNKVSVWEEYHEETVNEVSKEIHSLLIDVADDAFEAGYIFCDQTEGAISKEQYINSLNNIENEPDGK